MDSPGSSGTSEITESILVDTTGAPSLLAVTLQATGGSADALRLQVERMGRENFEKDRLQYFANRYVTAKRTRKVLYRDRPASNEFTIAEVFEINGFLKKPQAGMCTFQLPGNAVIDALRSQPKTSEASERPARLVLPHPCHLIHTFEVQSASLQPMAAPRLALENASLRFNRRQKSLHKYWSMTLEFSTLAGSVSSNQLGEHEKLVAQISQESAWSLTLPAGVSHLRPAHEFGQLPLEPFIDHPRPVVASKRERPENAKGMGQIVPSGRVDARRVRSMRTKYIVVLVILCLSLLIIGYLLFFLLGVRQLGM